MSDTAHLNARIAARWARRAVERMKRARHDIDELNVFPVPDGDTGTNLYDTVKSAYRAVEALTGQVTMHRVVEAMATGALRGARGNSGLILSVALRGVADALDGVAELDAPTFAGALELAAVRAGQAIAEPVHGTMVTVLHEMAAEARAQADAGADLLTQLAAVRERSQTALKETTGQLEVLANAQVVDAGSTGIVEMFDLLYLTAAGLQPPAQPTHYDRPQGVDMHGEVGLELVFWCAEQRDKTRAVTRALTKLGGHSIVVSWPKIHVHVADDSTALAVLVTCESLGIVQLRMEDLSAPGGSDVSVVGLTTGMGMLMNVALAEAVAVNTNVPGWIDHVEELVTDGAYALINGVPAAGGDLGTLAPPGSVISVSGPVALLSALAVFDPAVTPETTREEMAEAAAGTREGVVIRSHADGLFFSEDGQLRIASESAAEAIVALAGSCAQSAHHSDAATEIITLITGRELEVKDLEPVIAELKTTYPGVRVDVVEGLMPGVIAAVGCE